MKMKFLFLFLFVVLSLHEGYCAMSEQQMKAAMKLMRNVCQPKFKVTNEQIEGTHTGNWELDKNAKCYLWCILNYYKLITKENEFDFDTAVTTLNAQAPESLKGTALKAVTNCKDSVKTKTDKCEAGYEIAHCIYLDDPEKYFLP